MIICCKCGWDTGRSTITLFGVGPLCANCAFDKAMRAYDKLKKSKYRILKFMKNTIYPTEELQVGTEVQVINKGRGIVERVELTKDQHNQPIVVHHIRYKNGKVQPCNYSFIVRP